MFKRLARIGAGVAASRVCLAAMLAALVLFAPGRGIAAEGQLPALVINEDRGGPLGERFARVEQLRAERRRVVIDTGLCLSACTLYLGLPGTCVGARAVFGFHGPGTASGSIGLPRAMFDSWSRLMAEQYPPKLRKWFMNTARHRTRGYHYVLGVELIRLGVPDCAAFNSPSRSDPVQVRIGEAAGLLRRRP